MRRRAFIAGVGGAAAAWPLVARAQPKPLPVIGFLRSTGADGFESVVAAFRKGLAEAGFVEGRNVAIEFRYAENRVDRLPALVADLISRKAAVIVVNHGAALAAKAATTVVPIVFASGGDPEADGLVASLARPGGNVTGVVWFSSVLGPKRLQLLGELVPSATTIAMLVNVGSPEAAAERQDVQTAAQTLGRQLLVFEVNSERDIEAAFAMFVQRGAGAVLVGAGAFMNNYRKRLATLAARYRIPAMYAQREYVVDGGLMSYASSQADGYRQAGGYVARILKGAKPADLAVQQPVKFEMVLNMKAAKALGLTIAPLFLAQADEVIE